MAGVGGQTYTNPDLEDQEIEEGDVISKQATVFLVDLGPSMLEPCLENFTWADMALMNITNEISLDALEAPDNLHAVVLYGTKQGEDGVHVLLSMGRAGVARVRGLDPANYPTDDHLSSTVGSAPTPAHLSRMHYLAAGITKAKELLDKVKKGSGALAKSIYVMTTDQNPRGTGSGAKAYESQATGTRTSIASMAAEGIQVDVEIMHATEAAPDRAHWQELLTPPGGQGTQQELRAKAQGEEAVAEAGLLCRSQEELVSHLQRTREGAHVKMRTKKRTLSTVMLDFGPASDARFLVRIYNTFQKAGLPRYAYVDESNREIQTVTKYVSKGTGKIMSYGEVEHVQTRMGTRDTFVIKRADLAKAKQVAAAADIEGIRVLGFLPSASVQQTDFTGNGYFVYPDFSPLSVREGYVRRFLAIYEEMKRSNVCALCVRRTLFGIQLLVLLPTSKHVLDNTSDATGTILIGDGFWAAEVHWADQQRPLLDTLRSEGKLPPSLQIPELATFLAGNLVDSMRLGTGLWYSAESVYNPAIQRHYEVVRRRAMDTLEEYVPDNRAEDTTRPDASLSTDPLRSLIYDWARECQHAKGWGRPKVVSGATGAAGGGAGGRKRKAEDQGTQEGPSNAELLQVVQGGTVGKLKVTHLKQALSARGLKVTGTKDVLLERLQNYLSERG